MNQQQLIEQKAYTAAILHFHPDYSKDAFNACMTTYRWGYEQAQYDQKQESGEGERLRESIDIEQLIPELMDKRVEEVMREADRLDSFGRDKDLQTLILSHIMLMRILSRKDLTPKEAQFLEAAQKAHMPFHNPLRADDYAQRHGEAMKFLYETEERSIEGMRAATERLPEPPKPETK